MTRDRLDRRNLILDATLWQAARTRQVQTRLAGAACPEGRYLISGSRGSPRMRSAIWFRVISDVPPAMDMARVANSV